MSIFRGFHTYRSLISKIFSLKKATGFYGVAYLYLWLAVPSIGFTQSATMPPDLDSPPGSNFIELDYAVSVALGHSLELAGIRAQSEAIRASSSQAGALPDPMLSLNAMNLPTDTFDLDQEPMTQMQVALSQSFPFPGKRKLRREAVEFRAAASDDMQVERRNGIVGEVRTAWWQLMSLDKSLQIVEQNKDLLRDFIQIAQTKYKVGNGLQQDVLLAQLELSRLFDRELRLQGTRRGARAELNRLMNRPPDWVLTLPSNPANTVLPELPTERQLLQQAETGRALIDVQRQLIDAANANLDLARKSRLPDLKLGVGYGFRQGIDPMTNTDRSDFLSVMLSINLPIYSGSKQSKEIEQRSYEVSRQTLIMQDTLRVVEVAVSRNLASYLAARDQVLLLQTAIIPQARQTVSSMLAGYQVNQVDFLNLINTQITLYNAQISYWESLGRAKQDLARLASAIGVEALYE
jgi:cobalt-zinc-cadmium efflux system outer membrane protein